MVMTNLQTEILYILNHTDNDKDRYNIWNSKWLVLTQFQWGLVSETVVKLVVVFLKNTYEGVFQEEFFNKTNAFSEGLEQLLINKINIWWSCSRLYVLFKLTIVTYLYLYLTLTHRTTDHRSNDLLNQ